MLFNKKFHQVVILLTTTAFLTVIIFGLAYSMNLMKTRSDGTMSECPFMTSGSVCNMNFQEHLNFWKLIFTALPDKTNLTYILFLASLLFAATVIFRNNKFLENAEPLFFRQFPYIKQKKYLVIIDLLKEAFSQGILNPKIYKSVSF